MLLLYGIKSIKFIWRLIYVIFTYNMLEIQYIISGENNFKIFCIECRLSKSIWEFCIWRTLQNTDKVLALDFNTE